MKTISSFPILTEELLQKIRRQFSPYSFFYSNDEGEDNPLSVSDDASSVHPLSDEHGRWSPDLYGFGIRRTYTIGCATFLFGPNGVCCKNASIGLALVWKSPDSRQRSAIDIGVVADSIGPQSFSFSKFFPKPKFRGRVDFETIMYIKKSGVPTDKEQFLANTPGMVLGVLDKYSVLFDGAGSAFPISIISDPDGLLWSVTCDWDEPLVDNFNDCVSIDLNSAHKDFKYINPKDRAFNPSYLREVLAGAMTTIVNAVREDQSWDDVINGKSEEGSVGNAIYYFAQALNLNLDNARQCSIAFRDYFEKKLGQI